MGPMGRGGTRFYLYFLFPALALFFSTLFHLPYSVLEILWLLGPYPQAHHSPHSLPPHGIPASDAANVQPFRHTTTWLRYRYIYIGR